MKKYFTLIFFLLLAITSITVAQTDASERIRDVLKPMWELIPGSQDIRNINHGNVGIGTANPQAELEVNGGIRLNPKAIRGSCTAATAGTLWVSEDSTGNTLEFCKKTITAGVASLNTLSTTMPNAFHQHACAENGNNAIVCFGGSNKFGGLDTISVFDPTTGTSYTAPFTLPSTLGGSSCAKNSATGKIYCFGGYGTTTSLTQILEYDGNSATIKSATMPYTTTGFHSCVENRNTNVIYCFGGTFSDKIMAYSPELDATRLMGTTLPSARSSLSCVQDATSENIYCFGGLLSTGVDDTDEIIKYTPSTDTVTIMNAKLPKVTSSLSCASDGTNIQCFGGVSKNNLIDDIITYDPASDSVSTNSLVLPTKRKATTCVSSSADGYTYCIGGSDAAHLDEIIQFGSGFGQTSYQWTQVA